jgi:UDP-N-acetylglucosamine diphosphorylase/glucosamine-1-phosphate N-acetyltransferase
MMFEAICIFEDAKVQDLYPLTLTRPACELRCGMSSLREKIVKEFQPRRILLQCRRYLAGAVREETGIDPAAPPPAGDVLLVNGRLLADGGLMRQIETKEPCAFWCGEELVAAWLPAAKLQTMWERLGDFLEPEWLADLPRVEVEATLIRWPWDLVHHNGAEIAREFQLLGVGGQVLGKVYPNVALVGRENIFVGERAELWPGVVIMAEEGPVYIAEGAKIMANATIVGPAYIGPNTAIKIGAKIYEGTSIGEVCKVGGEVEESIIHSFSNKQHDGFLGHAYLGMWVNIGADTNNSDLKNNYAPVRVQINDRVVDTGSLFVGLFMGDHTKTGINTMFNTGSVVGVACNVYGEGFPPRYIPSFHWGGAAGLNKYDLEKTLETARRVMARRNRVLTLAQEAVLRHVYEMPVPPILDRGVKI